jgi:hypothetical protein
MESEEEDPLEREDDEDEEQHGSRSLVGFMFGNVDSNMRLEEGYLDEARLIRVLPGHLAPSLVGCMTLHANARANAIDVLTLGVFFSGCSWTIGSPGKRCRRAGRHHSPGDRCPSLNVLLVIIDSSAWCARTVAKLPCCCTD